MEEGKQGSSARQKRGENKDKRGKKAVKRGVSGEEGKRE